VIALVVLVTRAKESSVFIGGDRLLRVMMIWWWRIWWWAEIFTIPAILVRLLFCMDLGWQKAR